MFLGGDYGWQLFKKKIKKLNTFFHLNRKQNWLWSVLAVLICLKAMESRGWVKYFFFWGKKR